MTLAVSTSRFPKTVLGVLPGLKAVRGVVETKKAPETVQYPPLKSMFGARRAGWKGARDIGLAVAGLLDWRRAVDNTTSPSFMSFTGGDTFTTPVAPNAGARLRMTIGASAKLSRRLVTFMVASLTVASPAFATSSCSGTGSSARCKVDGHPWITENGGGAWSISSPSDNPNDLRFEVRHGDVAPWDATHAHLAERSEISDFKDKAPVESDIWFSFGMMVEPGAPVTSRWLVLGQLHATEDPDEAAGSPPWAQELDEGDHFRIVLRTTAEKPMRRSPAPIVAYKDPEFERGRVYHFVYRLRYSLTSGLLQVWRDGRQIVNYSGPLGYVDRQGPYFKFGIYRQPALETIAVHYYDLHFGGPEVKP